MNNKILFLVPVLLWTNIIHAQIIHGVVRDRQDEPIIGATIIVKNSKTYAVTDIDGAFSFAPSELPFTIRISSTGYKTQEIQFFELIDEPLEIWLKDENVLSEIVVTAHRRSDLLQELPIPVSMLAGDLMEDAGAFNVNPTTERLGTCVKTSSLSASCAPFSSRAR